MSSDDFPSTRQVMDYYEEMYEQDCRHRDILMNETNTTQPTPPANAGEENEPVLQGLPAIQARLRQLANDLWTHGADAVKAGDPDMFLRVADCIGDWAKTQWSLDETRRQRDEALAKLSRIPTASESAARDELIQLLRIALADAIRRPMGVVPDSASGLISQAELNDAEKRRALLSTPKAEATHEN